MLLLQLYNFFFTLKLIFFKVSKNEVTFFQQNTCIKLYFTIKPFYYHDIVKIYWTTWFLLNFGSKGKWSLLKGGVTPAKDLLHIEHSLRPFPAVHVAAVSENKVTFFQQNLLPAGKANRALLLVEKLDVLICFRSRFYRPLDLPSWHRCWVGDFCRKLKRCRSFSGSAK